MNSWYFLVPILLPALIGLCLPFVATDKKNLHQCVGFVLLLELVSCLLAAFRCSGSLGLIRLGDFVFLLSGDLLGKCFSVLFALVFLLAGFFGFEYFAHDERETSYSVFYLLTLSSLQGLCYAGNLFSFYLFYEMMTLCSLPLVLHERTEASRRAGMQYLGYSLLGASLALFGFFFAQRQCYTTTFTPGGALAEGLAQARPELTLLAAFAMLLGFGSKAGLLPLHAWLPIAHPEAPAPASAVLSAVITKGGVLGIIRVLYYVFGPDFLRGSWVQYTLLALALITVFMGSMLAYKEQLLKKRLAWSTVSQVSYALFGLFLLCPAGFAGAMLQILFHALAKTALFLSAGAIIHSAGFVRVGQLRGIGQRMPDVMWCFALASLSLVGIPPLGGFVSKWYLAESSFLQLGSWGWLGAAVLLVSALLTAGYLFPILAAGFFPGKDWPALPRLRVSPLSVGALLTGCAGLLIFGLWPTGLLGLFSRIAGTIL